MLPELFEIPFVHLTVKSYGLMMVIGFLSAVYLIRRLSRDITPDPQLITNAALYSLIAGVLGSRLFFVIVCAGTPNLPKSSPKSCSSFVISPPPVC